MTLPIGISNFCPPFTSDLMDGVRRLARAGFEAVDINLYEPSHENGILWRPDWREYLRQLRRLADDSGLMIYQVHGRPFSHIIEFEPPNEGLVRDIRLRIMEAAQLLGARWIVEHPLVLDEGITPENEASLLDFNAAHFAQLCDMAANFGVGIAMETCCVIPNTKGNIIGLYGNDIRHHREVANAIRRPNFGSCLDTGHTFVTGVEPAQMVRDLGDLLKVLHVHDNDGARDQHLAPGAGRIDWAAFAAALQDVGFEAPYSLEIHAYAHAFPAPFIDDALALIGRVARYLAQPLCPKT